MTTATILAMIALSLVAGHASARTPGKPQFSGYSGAVGPYRAGLEVIVQPDHKTVTAAHYFYVSKLQNISLIVQQGADPVDLAEAGGGVFHLRFVGNGSDHGAPLDFYNSVGLAGTWTRGPQTLPVTFQLETGGDVPAPGHRYAMIGNASDPVVEANAQRFLRGATTDDRDAVASAVSYPLRVNLAGGKHRDIADRSALLAQWRIIFTPRYVAVLKTAVPHEMFVNYRGAMAANGAVWFDDRGATVLNVLFGSANPPAG